MKITKDMLIGEVLDIDSSAAEYFFEIGMHCLAAPLPAAKALSRRARFTEPTATHCLKSLTVTLKINNGAEFKARAYLRPRAARCEGVRYRDRSRLFTH